jgi:hypothetical protein
MKAFDPADALKWVIPTCWGQAKSGEVKGVSNLNGLLFKSGFQSG